MEITNSKVEEPHLNGFDSTSPLLDPNPVLELVDNSCLKSTESDNIYESYISSEIPKTQMLLKYQYEKMILAIDTCDLESSKKSEEKLSVLQSYLQQLEEQNDILITAMTDLEQEAYQRVKQMEKRLKTTAKSTMESALNIQDCEQQMKRLVNERLHLETILDNMQQYLSTVKVENGFLRDQNFNLNHDVQSLLHVIHHARSTGHWEMDCVTFCEVTPEQVFGPVQSMSPMYSESPPSHSQSTDKEKKKQVFFDISQDISHFSASSPSINYPFGISRNTEEQNIIKTYPKISHELLEKNKVISMLEEHLAEAKHLLKLKDAECESHLCKLERLMQQTKEKNQCDRIVSFTDTPLLKSISLPDIGNIYSYEKSMFRSHSCRTGLGKEHKVTLKYHQEKSARNCKEKPIEHDDYNENEHNPHFLNCKLDIGFHRSQSEPHLFMLGDNIYVYKPCEPIQKTSLGALHENHKLSLPPCQSIDLKFPNDDCMIKSSNWNYIHNPDSLYPLPFQDATMLHGSSTSCDSGNIPCSKKIRGIDHSPNSFSNTFVSGAHRKCEDCCRAHFQSSCMLNSADFCENLKRCFDVVCSSTQTDMKKSSNSIGLQTDIKNDGPDTSYCNGVESFDSKSVQLLRNNLLKAKDEVLAKEMLVEKLKVHLTSIVKEVEMKDTALSNVEKKLGSCRIECTALNHTIISLEKEIETIRNALHDAKLQNTNLTREVDLTNTQIKEMCYQQKILQDQKRALLTQLDSQADELEDARRELKILVSKADQSAVHIEQQNQIIKSLQEALVQSKRAFDSTISDKKFSVNNNLAVQTKVNLASKSSIIDI